VISNQCASARSTSVTGRPRLEELHWQEAIDRGWYDPKGGKPFVWQEAYAPPDRRGQLNRLWLIYSTLAALPEGVAGPAARPATGKAGGARRAVRGRGPSTRSRSSPSAGSRCRTWSRFQRCGVRGTGVRHGRGQAWMVGGGRGGAAASRSPARHAVPVTGAAPPARDYARHRTHRAARLRHGGAAARLAAAGRRRIYWFYVDNPYVSTYVPVVRRAPGDLAALQVRTTRASSARRSARWAVDFADNLMHLRWPEAGEGLHARATRWRRSSSPASVDRREGGALYRRTPRRRRGSDGR